MKEWRRRVPQRFLSIRRITSVVFPVVLLLLVASSRQEAITPNVTITEFSDFQCPYCKRAAAVVAQVRQSYGERVEFVFKNMPLSFHPRAFKAAQASVCAAEQGKFWQYHDRLFAVNDLSGEQLMKIALAVHMNPAEFNACLDSEVSRSAVEEDSLEAERLGVAGTPTFFINGKMLLGALSLETFKQEIDPQLAKARRATLVRATVVPRTFIAPPRQRPEMPSVEPETAPPAAGNQPLPTLSINDVTLSEDSCQNKAFVFTVTLSRLMDKVVTVTYATSDGSPNQTQAAAANADYIPVAGTLRFTHDAPPQGPKGSYQQTITVPVGNVVVSSGANDARSFTLTLSGATNAVISVAKGVGTMLNAALSCTPAENGACFYSSCGFAKACNSVNLSAASTPYAALAGLGNTPAPDPDFETCHAAGLWRDTDGDGLSDAAESQGYIDNNANGVYDPGVDTPLAGANPTKPDVYLHYDYTSGIGHDHNPPARAIELVVEAFAAHGVTLHIDPEHNVIAESIAKVVTLLANGPDYAPDAACAGPSAKSMHQLREMFPNVALLKPAYHYAVFGHFSSCDSAAHCLACAQDPECGGGSPPPFGSTGSADINGDDVIVSLGVYTDSSQPIPEETWAGVFMHELGHNFGLKHGGVDCDNYKPNYLSVMSYSFYTTGIPVANAPGDSIPKACVADADCGPPPACPGPDYTQTDINGDSSQTVLAGSNDWTSLFFYFQVTNNFANAGAPAIAYNRQSLPAFSQSSSRAPPF